MNCFDIMSGLGRLWARDDRHASRRRGVALGKPAWKVRIASCLRQDITLCPRGRIGKGHPKIILTPFFAHRRNTRRLTEVRPIAVWRGLPIPFVGRCQ